MLFSVAEIVVEHNAYRPERFAIDADPTASGDSRTTLEPLFSESSHPALRRVMCEVAGGVVTLRGRTPTYYLKQVAIAAAKRLAGAVKVIDCLEVDLY